MEERSRAMVQTLREMGAEVLPIDVAAAGQASEATVAAIEAFCPDFVTSPNLNYFLKAAPDRSSMLDKLDIPMVVPWDDPLGAVSLTLLEPRQGQMGHLNAAGSINALSWFRDALDRPRLKHFAWDTGHQAAAKALGIVQPEAMRWTPVSTYSPYVEHGRRRSPAAQPVRDVAFCGNIYPGLLEQSNFSTNQFWIHLTDNICSEKLADMHRPVFELFLDEAYRMPPTMKEEHGITPESPIYWDYYVYCVWLAANTRVRLGLLSQIKREVEVFGLFADPRAASSLDGCENLRYRGNAGHFTELPEVYASTKINICIANSLIQQGTPSKLIDCLASGGFALSDPKDDLVTLFGEDVKAIFFRDIDELNAKIEYFLSRPAERQALVEFLRDIVVERCTLRNMYGEMVVSYV